MRRLGFSKPTRDPAEQERLFTSFRAAGYDGLQLKLNQYRADLDQPERFRSRWGAYPGVAAGLIVGARLDEPGVAQLRRSLPPCARWTSPAGSARTRRAAAIWTARCASATAT